MGKVYYSISEVAELLGVRQSTLRYWEQEFPVLRPKKNRAGNRAYREKDLKTALIIKRLLHDEGHTIDEARKLLRDNKFLKELLERPLEELMAPSDLLSYIRRELEGLLEWVRSW